MVNISVSKAIDNVAVLMARIETLTNCEVRVGIPADKTARKDTKAPITNAALAYIHEFGSPLKKIPARPFLFPGIRKAAPLIAKLLGQGARAAVNVKAGVPDDVAMKALHAAGMAARNSVVREITDPAPPFVPLKPATIRGRLRKTQAGRRKLRQLKQIKQAAGWNYHKANAALSMWAEAGNIHPLIDTAQLRAAITYVIRPSKGSSWAVGGRRNTPGGVTITGLNLSEQKYR
jgi:hypothetical protein